MRPLLMVLLLVGSAVLAGCAGPGEPAPGTSDGDDGTNATNPAGGGNGDGAPPSTEPGGECVSTLESNQSATTPTWVLETNMGTIRLTLHCDKAPVTTQNFVTLTEQGFFEGIKFHRVIAGFMNQAGDPLSKDDAQMDRWGTGGSDEDIVDEFYCADGTIDHRMDNPQYDGRPPRAGEQPHQACGGELGLTHDKAGVLSMANAGPNSGSSQFFITAEPTPFLDGAHPVFGETADQESLDVVLAINRVPTDNRDRPVEPVIIQNARIEWA